MMTVAKKTKQSGQALIELIIFLPLMFTLYSVISGFAGAIHASINQQKITRGYFYYRVQNNPNIPKPDSAEDYKSWQKFGMFFIGWKNYFNSNVPVMPCYKVSIPLKQKPTDKCEDAYTDPSTLFVRVGTVYGVCGATMANNGSQAIFMPDGGQRFNEVVDQSSCLITR